jgi:predicted phosphodiesterase
MKLHVLSDLHLGVAALERPPCAGDVVVLAGDIARPRQAVEWACGFERPVLYVPGNHEAYGSRLDEAVGELRRLSAGTPIHVLDGDELVLGGVRFLGATLWSDFRLFGASEAAREAAMQEAQRRMHDFSRIGGGSGPQGAFTPHDAAARFERDAAWRARRLATPHAGPTVVVTHHAPARGSLHRRFADALLSACFVSDAEHLLGAERVGCWIHGHTHDSFDYRLRGTRVVCNPRGYAKTGVNENARFDPQFTVEV